MRMNQAKPIRLSLEQACRIVWAFEDAAGRKLTAEEDALLMPMVEQIQVIHAQLDAEMGRPGRKAVDKSP